VEREGRGEREWGVLWSIVARVEVDGGKNDVVEWV